MIEQYIDYRDYLKAELELRIQNNPRYSLRAFSRDLNISPQILSLVLKNKKGISTTVAIQLAEKLNLSLEETNYFHDLVQFVHARSEAVRKVARARIEQQKNPNEDKRLTNDIFQYISEWYHYAILELTFLNDFKNDPRFIAKRLKISILEATQAIDRLKRLGLLGEINGSLVKVDNFITTTHDIPSIAIRKFTGKILEKANQALNTQEISERDFGTITIAINPQMIPKAKILIQKFRRNLAKILETGEQKEVYVISTQLFRLTEKLINKETL